MNQFAILKLKGDAAEDKEYQQPVNNIIQAKNWHVGYCVEKTPFGISQKILSVSHLSRKEFQPDQPFKEFPELKYYFPNKVSFTRFFQNRGFTRMYVVQEK